MDTGVDENPEGGDNIFKYRIPTTQKYDNLVLKRGLIAKNLGLAHYIQETLSGHLSTPIMTKSITVKLLDENGKALKSWHFANAYPVKWSISDYNSQDNQFAVESLEFAYSSFQTSL